MRLIIFIPLYSVSLLLLLLLVYNALEKNLFSQKIAQGTAVTIFVFSLLAFSWVMVSLVKAMRQQKWKRVIAQALFLILFVLLVKASFFVLMLYWGVLGVYTEGF
ncbi:MAG: hypothetical protein KDD28_33230 [Phaeodactylibacter sp.]|nr:hypothetical protein [Phaeodactylibacter sp.]